MVTKGISEISVVIPCFENFNTALIGGIYDTLSKVFNKFEVVLCTSSRYDIMRHSTITLTNNRPYLKCYNIKSKAKDKLIKYGVSCSMYNMVALVNLEDFTRDDLSLFTVLNSVCSNKRFNIFFSDSVVVMRSFDMRDMLMACNECSILELLGIGDYFNFSLFNINTQSVLALRDIYNSESNYNRWLKTRKPKKYNAMLCHLIGDRSVI